MEISHAEGCERYTDSESSGSKFLEDQVGPISIFLNTIAYMRYYPTSFNIFEGNLPPALHFV